MRLHMSRRCSPPAIRRRMTDGLFKRRVHLLHRPGVVAFDYDGLGAYRQRLMDEVHQIVEKEQIRGPRELGARLRKMKILAE